MHEIFCTRKTFLSGESIAAISFELPEKEWEELKETQGWQFVERFLNRKRKGVVNNFELLKSAGPEGARDVSEMIIALAEEFKTPEKLEEALKKEISEEELRHTLEAAQESDYPLFFSGMQ